MAPICHFLIGVPGAGKSTLAAQWCQHDPHCKIVSTDQIRSQLYGDEQVQGNWADIEAEVLRQVQEAVSHEHSVIYDATNANRPWRIDILQKFARIGADQWIGWQLKTDKQKCKQRNRQRSRRVEDQVIDSFANSIAQFSPEAAEGFVAVYDVPLTKQGFDFAKIQRLIDGLPRALINRRNGHGSKVLHQYSDLLDFGRLMHLIALLLRVPGVGLFHQTQPEQLQGWLGDEPITDSLSEISALMRQFYHPIYADLEKLAADLRWLEHSGLIGVQGLNQDIEMGASPEDATQVATHTYSDVAPFERLIKVIRCLAHYPCFRQAQEKTSLQALEQHLLTYAGLYTTEATLRKDIENVLKPYTLLADAPMKRGYFLGTAILAQHELAEVFRVLQTQAESLSDPIALDIYQSLQQKLQQSRLLSETALEQNYLVRAIGNQMTIDVEMLPNYAVARNLDSLVIAMREGRLLEMNRIAKTGRFETDPQPEGAFRLYPLQLVFHNIGWYLGYEWVQDEPPYLFKFERLDRLFVSRTLEQRRKPEEQKRALAQLHKLYRSSAGLFLGSQIADQQAYLSSDRKNRATVETTVEIWCDSNSFRFIRERTKRFPKRQMKMSRHDCDSQQLDKTIFSLDPTGDVAFPHRVRICLPKWCIEDVDLFRWIVGYGGSLKVIHPPELVAKVRSIGDAIHHLYNA
jgi:predicted kinase